jgi:hypothetical protein
MHTALRATSQTLRTFLQSRFETAPDLRPFFDSGSGGTMVVALQTPREMIRLGSEGVSVWLYRIIRDDQTLNAPPRRVSLDETLPPPLPLRLHYLVTPLTAAQTAGGSETEQVILGKVLQLFHDRPRLGGSDLRDELVGTDVELQVRLETMSLEEITRVWDALEGSYQLSVSYEVSIVNIDSERQPDRAAPVTVVTPEHMVRRPLPQP